MKKKRFRFQKGEHVLILVKFFKIREYDRLQRRAAKAGAKLTYAVTADYEDVNGFDRIISLTE